MDIHKKAIKRSWNITTKHRKKILSIRTEMNLKPSQLCGPPTWDGTSLNVPLPQSATLLDMCVYGPIVYDCLDSVLRSQVHLLQQRRPGRRGAILSPLVGMARSPAARVACESESGTADLCVREWECARLGENACRDGKRYKKIRRETIEKRNNKFSKGFRKEILPLCETDPQVPERKNFGHGKQKKSSSKDFIIFFFLVNF